MFNEYRSTPHHMRSAYGTETHTLTLTPAHGEEQIIHQISGKQ